MLGSMFSTNAANSPPPPSGSSYKNKNGQAWLGPTKSTLFPSKAKRRLFCCTISFHRIIPLFKADRLVNYFILYRIPLSILPYVAGVFDPCFVEDRGHLIHFLALPFTSIRPSLEAISSTLVWIRFPEMPVEFFQEELLMRIGNRIGRAVKVDETTMAASRGRYARVCVEVDLTKPLVSMITLLGFAQAVEYEGLHQICFDCGKYGQKKISAQTQKENPL
ncbi:hypothetical protein Sango_0004100 [Sesamum angolense]|uniref:DUF4283 domain-containing protein n=1 Tax=Sesamum angolense TaxID=2727404 RepID=A0AAE2C521_9LAMI|nr:hypothetical protein Sango_0004100 [Sesamum angolense]